MKPETIDRLIEIVKAAMDALSGSSDAHSPDMVSRILTCLSRLNFLLGYLEGLKGGDAK